MFSTDLHTARKKAHLTQDELSKLINVSRTAISHWETGRTQPDKETLKKLNNVLHAELVLSDDAIIPVETATSVISSENDRIPVDEPCDTASSSADEESEQTDPPSSEQTGTPDTHVTKTAVWISWLKKPLVWILLVCCVSLGVFLAVRSRSSVEYVSDEGTHYTPEYLSQSVPNDPEKPFLHLTPSLEIIHGDGMNFWMYTVKAVEMNNLPITIDRVEEITLTKKGGNRRVFSKGDLHAMGKDTDIPANGYFTMNGGLPVQDIVLGIGLVINAQGREFRTWIPMNE